MGVSAMVSSDVRESGRSSSLRRESARGGGSSLKQFACMSVLMP